MVIILEFDASFSKSFSIILHVILIYESRKIIFANSIVNEIYDSLHRSTLSKNDI